MLTVTAGMLWTIGCSSKGMRTGGETTTAPPSTTVRTPAFSESDLSGLSGIDSSNPGLAMAKVSPSERKRQAEEGRAEDKATSTSGLRDVFFGYDSWTISDEGRQALTQDAEWLRTHQAVQLRVEGHCDERGSAGYNFILAEKRAKAVRNYLMDLGIKSDRLLVVSYGKERPFCKDRSEACYQQNRRGHLVVKP
jgi:peptidoglycan-associated lipoprotein